MTSRLRRPSPGHVARAIATVVVVLVALELRLLAVERLPTDYDEDDYLRAGQLYADGLRDGDPGVLLRENYRPEHPPLTKIVTGLALLPLDRVAEIPDRPTTAPPATDLPEPHRTVARIVQAVEGTLGVAALAVISPLAGLYLAVHSWSIKYTSQVMLEALPAALVALAVLAYLRARPRTGPGRPSGRSRRRGAWLAVAAICFGLACASKYPYGIVGLAILADWGWSTRPESWTRSFGRWLRPLVLWTLAAAAVFFLADPYLWPDPIGRLGASLSYHLGYASSEAVAATGWPSWQALVWLFGSVPFHASGTFVVTLDVVITVLAMIGLRRLWARQRVLALWLVFGALFLLVWPTKWPQYLLLISTPLAAAAAHGTWIAVLEPIRAWIGSRWRARPAAGAVERPAGRIRREGRDLGRALPWLAPGLLAITVLCIVPLLFETAMAVTDFQRTSIRDGINGGVLREAIGGLTGAIPARPFDLNASGTDVHYVGLDLLGAFTGGVWLGGNTSAEFPAFSFLWMILAVGLQTAVGVGVAIVLSRPGVRFVAFWRTLFILPWAIPEFVGAIAWRTIVHPDNGWIALLLGSPFGWPGSPDASLVVLLVAATWVGWPLMMLVATAGLRTIPQAVKDAAQLDGAGRIARFRQITLPLLLPLLAPALVDSRRRRVQPVLSLLRAAAARRHDHDGDLLLLRLRLVRRAGPVRGVFGDQHPDGRRPRRGRRLVPALAGPRRARGALVAAMRPMGFRVQLASQAILVIVGIFVVVPVWVLAILATDASIQGLPRNFELVPAVPTADRFVEAWVRTGHELDFLGLLRNSLFVSGLSSVVALVFGASMAYAFARFRFAGRRVGLFVLLIGAFLPPIALATPLFVLFFGLESAFPALRAMGFHGSTLALAILYAAFSLPLAIWLMRAAFWAVPAELEDAALVDGAGRIRAFASISLPIAAPSILVAALVAFLLGYSEFALAWLFASTEQNTTLAMVLASAQVGFYSTNWGQTAAHALLMTVPVVVIFVALQRLLLRGSLVGSASD